MDRKRIFAHLLARRMTVIRITSKEIYLMKRLPLIVCTLILTIAALVTVPYADSDASGYEYIPLEVYTPQGSAVYAHRRLEATKSNDIVAAQQVRAQYEPLGAVVIGDVSAAYNCYAYAFLAREPETVDCWLDNPLPYMTDNSYILLDEPEVGCVVTYSTLIEGNYVWRDETGEIIQRNTYVSCEFLQHAGVVVEVPEGATDIQDLTVESKWGGGYLYRHKGDICPYIDDPSYVLSWKDSGTSDAGVEVSSKTVYHYYRANPDNYANKPMHIASEATSETVKNGLWTDEDGNIRYYINGQAQFAGVVSDTDGHIYYIDSTCRAVSGEMVEVSAFRANSLLEEGTYFFSQGEATPGQIVDTDSDTPLNAVIENPNGKLSIIVNGEPAGNGLLKLNENDYYFVGNDGYAIRNRSYYITTQNANGLLPSGRYTFDDDGTVVDLPELLAGEDYANGLIRFSSGKVQYMENGKATYAGLVQSDEGDYYFISSSLRELKNIQYSIPANKTNGLLPAGTYSFGADGKITALPTILAGEDYYNGLIRMSNGVVQYLQDGKATYAGLVMSDDGDYYFIGPALRAICNSTYTVNATRSNGLLPADVYSFDADGKLTDLPQILAGTDYMNGLIRLASGSVRYLKDGVSTFAGLVMSDAGDYYYIDRTLKAVIGKSYKVSDHHTNGLLPGGTYTFDDSGRITGLPTLLAGENLMNGLVQMPNGVVRYNVDGCATFAKLVRSDAGDLYYIGATGQAVCNTTYYLTKNQTNGLLPSGSYTFNANGVLQNLPELLAGTDVTNGLVRMPNGNVQYLVDGSATYAGLVMSDAGDLYYIGPALRAVTNTTFTIPEKMTNGLLPAGTYRFAADGKLIIETAVDPAA